MNGERWKMSKGSCKAYLISELLHSLEALKKITQCTFTLDNVAEILNVQPTQIQVTSLTLWASALRHKMKKKGNSVFCSLTKY